MHQSMELSNEDKPLSPSSDPNIIDRLDSNEDSFDRSPNLPHVTSTTVQAHIARSGREILNRYPIGASLLRPDLMRLVSNLSIADDPHPTAAETNLLLPFHHSLSLIDRGLSANQELPPAMEQQSISPTELNWVQRQLASVNRLIEQHSTQPINFDDLPYSLCEPVILQPDSTVPAVPSTGPAATHAACLRIPSPSPFSAPTPGSGGRLEHADPGEIKSFYSNFVSLTLQQQLSQARHHYQIQHTSSTSNPPSAGVSSPSTSRASVQQENLAPYRQATESPDPLAMNLATRSANRSRSNYHLTDDVTSPSTPSRKKKRPNPPSHHPHKPPNQILTARITTRQESLVSPAITKPSSARRTSPIKLSSGPTFSSQSLSPVKPARQPPTQTPCQDLTGRFLSLVEDILEADDMTVFAEYFCQLQSQLVLSPPILSNIKSFLEQSNGEVIHKLPPADLSRLIKILERAAKVVEELIIIPPELKQKHTLNRSLGGQPPSSKKPESKEIQWSGSKPAEDSNTANLPPTADSDNEGMHVHAIEEGLKDLSMALPSIDVALDLLAHDKYIPKQLYSEELIQSIVKGTKDQLITALFPLVEADEKGNMDTYSQKLRRLTCASKIICGHISSSLSFFATSIVPKIDLLVRRVELSESIIINVSFIAIIPFFVHSSTMTDLPGSKTKSKKISQTDGSMKAMRLECLKLLRNISSKYPDQRGWIVEEILNSILNLPEQSIRTNKTVYHLANGKSIQIFSALLLHIVQCCHSGARSRVKIMLSASDPSPLDSPITTIEANDGAASPYTSSKITHGNVNFEAIKEFIETEVLAATKLSKKIISFLLQKSGKSSKSTLEAHYKTVFDRLIEDLINVLFLPEWPVAEFMLGLFCKTMISFLDTNKISADTNAVKSMCLDHLGLVTAKLMEPVDHRLKQLPPLSIPSLSFKAMVKALDQKSLSQLFQLQKMILTFLDVESNSSDLGNTAADFAHAQWICEMIGASNALQSSVDRCQTDTDADQELFDKEAIVQQKSFLSYLNSLIEELGLMHSIRAAPAVSRLGGDESSMAPKTEPIMEAISQIQGLKGLADVFLEKILATSASPSVTFRSKAIKAIALIVAKDETVFFQESVKKGIENRMLDSSPAVRDAAVELVGRYVVDRPDLAVSYLPQISARVADKGVSVRRRVVKLLKSIYLILKEEQWIDLKVDISHRLISRIHDEEISIRDLAMGAIDELWFGQITCGKFDSSLAGSILIKVTAACKELPSPIEACMKLIFKHHSEQSSGAREQFDSRCKEIIEKLIDRLMDFGSSTRDHAFSEVECVKTICLLTLASPKLLEPNKALMLLPYLKGATTSSENLMVQYLLKIFRSCVTLAHKSSDTFGDRLQSTLLVLVNKPNLNGGGAVLQELIACFCAVVIHRTRDYDKLLNVFKACDQRLRNEIKQLDDPSTSSCSKSLPVLMYLVSTLVAYGQLDQLPDGQVYIQEASKTSSQMPMHVHAYDVLFRIYHAKSAEKIRSVTLTCLGFLYRSFPSLMTRSESISMMDSVFADDRDSDLQHRLLKLIIESISNQIEKMGGDEEQSDAKEVDVNQLIGNVDRFADSGVVSAIVQRYLGHITTLAQSTKPHIQKTAVDIISFTIKQGLTHPLECVPVLVALESSGDVTLAKQVLALHTLLHVQRGNLVHCRFLETMNKVFDWHSKSSGTSSFASGYLLNRSVMASWYTLLSEKRIWRISFSKSLTKSFSIDPQTDSIDERTIAFQRYLAEALLTLEIKTEEEVMVLIESLNRIVGQSAYHTLHLLGGDPLKALLNGGEVLQENGKNNESQFDSKLGFNSSIVLGIGFVLRDLLKALYGISDHKLSRYADGIGKVKSKTLSKDKLTARTWSVKEVTERLDMELRRKVPGLDRSLDETERHQKQLAAFGDLVKYDCEVLENSDHLEMMQDEERSLSADGHAVDKEIGMIRNQF